MARLLPLRSPVERRGTEPRVVGIDDEAADEVFSALSSGTGRELLAALYEEPRTASDLADVADTSLQNARYHIGKLTDAGLVEVVDTWYSDRGTEMKVYAPADTSLVVFAGDDADRTTLLEMVKRVLGAVGILGVASLLVERLATGGLLPAMGSGGASGDGVVPGGANEDAAPSTAAGGGRDGGTRAAEGTSVAQTGEPTQPGATTADPSATAGDATTAADTVAQTGRASETGGEATTAVETAAQTAAETTTTATELTTTVQTTSDAAREVAAAASPGLLFFAGGLLVVALATGWWALNR